MQDSTFIGLDVHKATISVAIAEGVRGGEVRHLGKVPHRPDQVRKLVVKLTAKGARLHFCYEAGPCGYGLYRQLVEMGHDCIVVAPSLIPVKEGDRVKTDRRDAVMLAKLHRAGELTAVWVPDAAHEAMRDLVRARATAMRVAGKARQHLQGFLLRHSRNLSRQEGLDGGIPALACDSGLHTSSATDRPSGLHRCRRGCRSAGRAPDAANRRPFANLEPRAGR